MERTLTTKWPIVAIVSFMWVTCPSHFYGRRQQGTMVRLGSCLQTIPGPSAISSCFLYTKALTKVDCTYLFLFYKVDMKDGAVYVCLLWLGFCNGNLKRLPQRIKWLVLVWCWTQVILNSRISWLLCHSADINLLQPTSPPVGLGFRIGVRGLELGVRVNWHAVCFSCLHSLLWHWKTY